MNETEKDKEDHPNKILEMESGSHNKADKVKIAKGS